MTKSRVDLTTDELKSSDKTLHEITVLTPKLSMRSGRSYSSTCGLLAGS